MRTKSLLLFTLVSSLLLLLCHPACGSTSYLTAYDTPLDTSNLPAPTSDAYLQHLYISKNHDAFIAYFTQLGVWRADYNRTGWTSWCNNTNTCGTGYNIQHFLTELADSDGFIFLCSVDGTLYRYDINDVTVPTAITLYPSQRFQMAIDPNRKIGFTAAYRSETAFIIDLVKMTINTTFNVTEKLAYDVMNSDPGVYVPLIDTNRNILWFSTNCENPTPGRIWRYDVKDISNPVFLNLGDFFSGACFESGFIEPKTGYAWLYEDDAAAIIRVDDKFRWSSDYWVHTADYANGLFFEPSLGQALWVDSSRGNNEWSGGVYRHCIYQPRTGNVAEVVNWSPPSSDYAYIQSVYFDGDTRTLYLPVSQQGSSLTIWRVEVSSSTDCRQDPIHSSASTLTSPVSFILSFF